MITTVPSKQTACPCLHSAFPLSVFHVQDTYPCCTSMPASEIANISLDPDVGSMLRIWTCMYPHPIWPLDPVPDSASEYGSRSSYLKNCCPKLKFTIIIEVFILLMPCRCSDHSGQYWTSMHRRNERLPMPHWARNASQPKLAGGSRCFATTRMIIRN
jgi:hypothetical protein